MEEKDPQVLIIRASGLGFHEALGGDSPQWLRHSPALREGGHPPGFSLPGLGAAEATFGGGGWRFRGKMSKGWGGWLGCGPRCVLPTPSLTVLFHQHPSLAHPGARAGGAPPVPSHRPSHPAVMKGTCRASARYASPKGHMVFWRGYVSLSRGPGLGVGGLGKPLPFEVSRAFLSMPHRKQGRGQITRGGRRRRHTLPTPGCPGQASGQGGRTPTTPGPPQSWALPPMPIRACARPTGQQVAAAVRLSPAQRASQAWGWGT